MIDNVNNNTTENNTSNLESEANLNSTVSSEANNENNVSNSTQVSAESNTNVSTTTNLDTVTTVGNKDCEGEFCSIKVENDNDDSTFSDLFNFDLNLRRLADLKKQNSKRSLTQIKSLPISSETMMKRYLKSENYFTETDLKIASFR